jgi:hypothetical protein
MRLKVIFIVCFLILNFGIVSVVQAASFTQYSGVYLQPYGSFQGDNSRFNLDVTVTETSLTAICAGTSFAHWYWPYWAIQFKINSQDFYFTTSGGDGFVPPTGIPYFSSYAVTNAYGLTPAKRYNLSDFGISINLTKTLMGYKDYGFTHNLWENTPYNYSGATFKTLFVPIRSSDIIVENIADDRFTVKFVNPNAAGDGSYNNDGVKYTVSVIEKATGIVKRTITDNSKILGSIQSYDFTTLTPNTVYTVSVTTEANYLKSKPGWGYAFEVVSLKETHSIEIKTSASPAEQAAMNALLAREASLESKAHSIEAKNSANVAANLADIAVQQTIYNGKTAAQWAAEASNQPPTVTAWWGNNKSITSSSVETLFLDIDDELSVDQLVYSVSRNSSVIISNSPVPLSQQVNISLANGLNNVKITVKDPLGKIGTAVLKIWKK